MKIAQVHNRYLTPGGEDTVLAQEAQLLDDMGHDVVMFEGRNDAVKTDGAVARARAVATAIWSRAAQRRLGAWLTAERPDIVHVHNTFAALSPAVFRTAARFAAVVWTVHNFRAVCANAELYRDGAICEACVGRPLAWPALRHRCYRGSLAQTGVHVATQTVHRVAGTYARHIDVIVALNRAQRDILIRAGFAAEQIVVKPNFVAEPPSPPPPRATLAFAGKIEAVKGVDLLLAAWAKEPTDWPWALDLIGDGSERAALQQRFAGVPGVTWHGWVPRERAVALIGSAQALVMPSRWYEGMPMVMLEALAMGVPVIAPNHAGFPDVIVDDDNGFLYTPGDAAALRGALERLASLQPSARARMRAQARAVYTQRFSPAAQAAQLDAVYAQARARAARRLGA